MKPRWTCDDAGWWADLGGLGAHVYRAGGAWWWEVHGVPGVGGVERGMMQARSRAADALVRLVAAREGA